MTTYIRVKLLEGVHKGAHIDVPEEIADRPEYQRLKNFEPSNFDRRPKLPAELKDSGDDPDGPASAVEADKSEVEPSPDSTPDEGTNKKKG